MTMTSTKKTVQLSQRMLQVHLILGFLGVEKDYPEQKSSLPIKKERSCEVAVQEKE